MKDCLIICRCSTDENTQDVTLQIKPCSDYCDRQGWSYDVLSYYASGSKGIPPELQQALDSIVKKEYKIVLVYSMDRFSRQIPSLTEKMLNYITECGCRFITILENLDSDNPMLWYSMKGMWLYFANLYSLNLSKKVKLGMEAQAEKIKKDGFAIQRLTGKKITGIGRPKGSKDKRKRSKKGYYNRKHKLKGNLINL